MAKQNLLNKKRQLALIEAQQIDRFYDTLNNFSEKFPLLLEEDQHQLIHSLIKRIIVKDLSPHWVQLVVEWSEAVSLLDRPDVCLVWRNISATVGGLTEEELQIIQEMYSQADRLALMKRLPQRSWLNIKKGARLLKVKYPPTCVAAGFPLTMCWADMVAWECPEQAIAVAQTLLSQQKKKGRFLAGHWLFPAAFVQSAYDSVNKKEVEHSTGDVGVPAANSDLYAASLKAQGIPYDYIRGDMGGHGFGLQDSWAIPCIAWFQQLGFC